MSEELIIVDEIQQLASASVILRRMPKNFQTGPVESLVAKTDGRVSARARALKKSITPNIYGAASLA